MKQAYRSLLLAWFFLVIGIALAGILNLIFIQKNVFADAVSGSSKTPGIASITERWLRYKGVEGCYGLQDVGKNSIDEITAGTWLKAKLWDTDTAIGYINDDGSVSCGDGAFISNSLKKIGFAGNKESFCSMSTAKRGDSKDYKKCIDGPGTFDMEGGTSEQVKAFKASINEKVPDSALFMSSAAEGPIKYYIGLQSLIKFCGGKDVGAYDDSMKANVGESKRQVVVNAIDLATGKLERRIYSISKNQGDTIDHIWGDTTNDGTAGATKTCAELAQLTWQYDDAFAAFVKGYNIQDPDNVPKEKTLTGADAAGGDSTIGTSSCAIDGVGWLVCPVMKFLGNLNDAAFGMLNNFLEVNDKITTSDTLAKSWGAFRNIANICFVIAFLIIIYSQLTGAGITNYGLKRLLPKLIIAAILVNASLILCQIAVDISNIVGSNIYDMLRSFTVSTSSATDEAGGWSTVIAGLLTVAVGVGLLVAIILAPTALLALGAAVLVLTARQAIIVLLIVISPLAFVAYLLPNTEQWFKRWWKIFSTMLMLYPVVGVVFGASTLAASIIATLGGEADGGNLMQLMALGVMAVPLFAVPTLLKGSLAAAGAMGNQIAKLQSGANKMATKGVKNGRLGEAKTAFDARRQERRLKRRVGDGRLGKINQAIDRSRFGRRIGGDRGAAAATAAVHQQFDDEVKRQKTLLSGRSNDSLLKDLRTGKGSAEYQAAVAGTIMSRGHRDSHLEALDIMRSRNLQAEKDEDTQAMETVSSVQKQMMADMKNKPWALGDQAAGQLVEGTYGRKKSETGELHKTHFANSIQQQLQDRVGTKLSAQSLATMDPDEMRHIHTAAMQGDLTADQMAKLKGAITAISQNKQMQALVKPEAQAQFDQIMGSGLSDAANRAPNNAATQQEAIDINNRRDAEGNSPDEGSLF